jgi:hypothetical protein
LSSGFTAAEDLALDRHAAPLVVVEPDPSLAMGFFQDVVLGAQIHDSGPYACSGILRRYRPASTMLSMEKPMPVAVRIPRPFRSRFRPLSPSPAGGGSPCSGRISFHLSSSAPWRAAPPARAHGPAEVLFREATRLPEWVQSQVGFPASIPTELAGRPGLATQANPPGAGSECSRRGGLP